MGSGCSTVQLSGLLVSSRAVCGAGWGLLVPAACAGLCPVQARPCGVSWDAVMSSSWYRWQSQQDLSLLLQ